MQLGGQVSTGSNYSNTTRAAHNARIIIGVASGSTNIQSIGVPLYDGFAGRGLYSNPSIPSLYAPGGNTYLNNFVTSSTPIWQLSPTNFITQNIIPSGGLSVVVSPTSSLGIAIIPTGSRGQYVKFFLQAFLSQSAFAGAAGYTTISNVTLTTARGYTAASVGGGTNVYDPASNYALLG
jgi:hypothetical protein